MIAKMNSRKTFITIAASTDDTPRRIERICVERSPVERSRVERDGAAPRWATGRVASA